MIVDRGADLHTHSSWTDGIDPLPAMAVAARDTGLTTLGCSDHVRADSTWLPGYVTAVRALATDGLQIRCGVETKILDAAGTLDMPADLTGVEYVLIADHQFPGPDGPVHPRDVAAALTAGTRTPDGTVDELVAATTAAVRRTPLPAVVAHLFSILPKLGLTEEQVGGHLLDELAAACRAVDAAVEVNEKWRCPSPRVIAHLHRAGVRITAGSDAHRAAAVGAWRYLDEVERGLLTDATGRP